MSKNSTVNLLGLLSEKERSDLAFVIKGDSNQRLEKLFLYLCEGKNISDKKNRKELYVLLFEEAYAESKDNKLRNELRLLGNRIRRYMASKTFTKELNERASYCSLQYLDYLLSKGSYEIFEIEAKRAVKEYLKENNFGLALQVSHKYAIHLAHNHAVSLANFKEVQSMLRDCKALSAKDYFHISTRLEAEIQYANAILTILYEPKESLGLSEDSKVYLNEFDFEDDYLIYMKLKAQSYQTVYKDRVDINKKMLALIPKIKKYSFNNKGEKASALINLGMSYFMQNKAETSLPYFEEGMNYIKDVLPHQKSAFIFNYLSALIKCERYELAIEVINKYSKILFGSKTTHNRVLCIKAMAHLLLGEGKSAEKTMPNKLPKKDFPESAYFRLINCLIYFSRGDRALALNECNNLIKTLKYDKVLDKEAYHSAMFSKEYFQICMKLTIEKERKKAFKDLKKKIGEYHQDNLIILPSKWVLQEIGRELGMKKV